MNEEEPVEIPLFPLPSVVLFPRSTVPLYIFEPRYRQMTADSLRSATRRIVMVAVDEAHWPEMQGDPPVCEVGCEGEIMAAEKNDDGSFKILLRGTRRVRIVSESPPGGERLYRIAQVETRPDVIDDDDREALRNARSELFVLFTSLAQRTMPNHAHQFGSDRFKAVEDAVLVNVLAQAIDLEPRDKQQLLEIDRVLDRQRMLCELVRFRIAELDGRTPTGSSTVH